MSEMISTVGTSLASDAPTKMSTVSSFFNNSIYENNKWWIQLLVVVLLLFLAYKFFYAKKQQMPVVQAPSGESPQQLPLPKNI